MKLNYQELSTVLAALRLLQDQLEENPCVVDIMPHFDDVECLTIEQINGLCEDLNCEE